MCCMNVNEMLGVTIEATQSSSWVDVHKRATLQQNVYVTKIMIDCNQICFSPF